ncbi:DNA polymerase IV [Simiduia curdlanivorans]|uniref:DNA polymerase IV n=1 Tax=Simiduia curdlanivorans TaxID=1492769 RepID=A0ABV8V5U0_9GAMM|nr:DNA polymerase IV [Simiduia curdlanivorans]MDN3638589.1 DNA polymerase IV [Simiduia curdlanivorans]
MQRKIIHIDADCFYAAVEVRDNPALQNKAVAVGGDPGRRGVISTCNYAARAFGVHSAMATKTALRLCPHLTLLPHRFDVYRQASLQMRQVFAKFTDLIEPLSLDEAFLDVSQCDQYQGSATRIAQAIRAEIQREVGITVSAGVAPNKFLAKVASDWRKPDGLFVIRPDQIDQFVVQLPVKRIFGVGKVTAAKMLSLGVETCADLQQWSELELTVQFGSFGSRLYQLARGIDNRLVSSERVRKSLSVENTYATDLKSFLQCRAQLPSLVEDLLGRLAKLDQAYVPVKCLVKVKFADFTSTTLERTGLAPNLETYAALLKEALERKSLPIRLLGVGVRFNEMDSELAHQLDLFESNI